ncbi:MAG: proline--tRNA ligase [Acidobacteria bacterium]|nr:proline--tRNA ligase [Acidobacteriota bacterium]
MRASQLFLPTLRTDPADAEAVSHKLLVRGGFIRQVAAGVWTYLPLGWRVHQKVVQIIREEINAIGGQEFLCPLLTPAELWKASGRYDIPEVFHLQDRNGRDYVLPMTQEETFAFHAREIQSYKQLPQIWYHFSVKERDEPRPRAGLIRVREFIMKDAYSFDRDSAALDVSYEKHRQAYDKIFARAGLETYLVEAEVGIMGGKASDDFLAPADAGENELVRCENGDYAADVEIARGVPSAPDFPGSLPAPELVETPDAKTIEAVSAQLGIDPRATIKAMPVVTDGRVVLALVRGDDRLNGERLTGALGGAAIRPAEDDEIRSTFGADGGSIGPVGVQVEVIADQGITPGPYVVGANRDGWHLRGVEPGRDFEPRYAEIRHVKDGDACPICGGRLSIEPAIEVGHIFKLGTRFPEAIGATYLDEDGEEKPVVMGSYGIGPGRMMAAAIEQHHDDRGIRCPRSIAPYDVHVVSLDAGNEAIREAADAVDRELSADYEVLLDDRDLRAGEKFADADLIGCPVRVTVGKKTLDDGAVDVRDRGAGNEVRVELSDLRGTVAEIL